MGRHKAIPVSGQPETLDFCHAGLKRIQVPVALQRSPQHSSAYVQSQTLRASAPNVHTACSLIPCCSTLRTGKKHRQPRWLKADMQHLPGKGSSASGLL